MPRKPDIAEIMEKMWVPPRDLVILGVAGSEKTVYNWVSSGKSPIPHTKFGHRRLFKLSDVLAYLEKHTVTPEE
jgi:excisionase family DNA binding protein